MPRFLRSCWKHVWRALAGVCWALVAPLPGIDHMIALAKLPSPRTAERAGGSGCIDCDPFGLGCDAGRPHWIWSTAATISVLPPAAIASAARPPRGQG